MSSISHMLTIQAGECEVMSLKFSPDDLSVACGCTDGSLKVFSDSGSLVATLPCYQSLPFPVTSVRYRPIGTSKTKNILIATTCEGLIYHYHVSSGKLIHIDSIPVGILSCDFSNEGNFYAVGCDDFSVRLYDENTKSVISIFGEETRNMHHSSRVMCVKWVDHHCFWTGGWDKNVVCWDVRSRNSVRHFYGPKICGEAIEIYNNSVITGAYDVTKQVSCWDIRTCQKLRDVTVGEDGEKLLVYSLQKSKGNRKVLAVAGSGKNAAYFYDLESLRLEGIVSSIQKPVYSVDFANSRDSLAFGSGDGTVRLFSL